MFFPKGTYFVGDPVDALDDKTYFHLLEETVGFQLFTNLTEDLGIWFKPLTPDGSSCDIWDEDGNLYTLSWGILSIIPAEIARNKELPQLSCNFLPGFSFSQIKERTKLIQTSSKIVFGDTSISLPDNSTIISKKKTLEVKN